MKKLAALALLLVAGGCRMCADSCDYGPVVPGGPPLGLARSGSNLSGGYYTPLMDPALESVPQAAPDAPEAPEAPEAPLTPQPLLQP